MEKSYPIGRAMGTYSTVLPNGGTTGQVLAKKSNADQDVEWKSIEQDGLSQNGVISNDVQDLTLPTEASSDFVRKYDALYAKRILNSNIHANYNVARIGESRAYCNCVSYEDKIYIIGGRSSAYYFGVIDVYDIKTQKTTRFGTLPADNMCVGMCSSIVGNKIYIFGGKIQPSGFAGTDMIQIANIEEGSIIQSSTVIPYKLSGAVAESFGQYIYIFGGGKQTTDGYVNNYDILKFNTVDGSIDVISDKLIEYNYEAAVQLNDKIYLIRSGAIDEFDPTTNNIVDTEISISGYGDAVAINDRIYLIKGYSSIPSNQKIYEIDVSNKTVKTLSTLTYSYNYRGVASIGNTIYLVAGLYSSASFTNGVSEIVLSYTYDYGRIPCVASQEYSNLMYLIQDENFKKLMSVISGDFDVTVNAPDFNVK